MTESATKPLRVCLVVPVPPPHGGVSQWAQLLRDYAQGRTDVVFSIVDTCPHWRQEHDRSTWKRVLFSGTSMLGHVGQLLLRIVRGCDVVHITTSGELATYRDMAMMALCRLLGVPAMYHMHFGRIPRMAVEGRVEWKRLRLAMRLAHTVIVLDKATEQTIRRELPQVRVCRVANGVDVTALPAPRDTEGGVRTAVYVGWVVPEKGINELILAWSEMRPAGWRLVIVGPVEAEYQRQLLDRYRPESVEFAGRLPHAQAMERLAGAEILVLPSHTEGFPNVIVEAMSLGKAVIGTTVGAIPEMLSDGCGIAFAPQQVDRLKESLGIVMGDAALRMEMGRRAKDRAHAEYQLPVVFGTLYGLWRGAASGADYTEAAAGAAAAAQGAESGKTKPVQVCMVSYIPPPYGGIGHWTMMVERYAQNCAAVKLRIVNVSPRWRQIDDLRVWKRIVFGGATMLGHVCQVVWRLITGCRVVHITTPGQLSVFRDVAIIAVARLFRARTIYHIRFGRIPEIAEKNTAEWRRMALAMRMAYEVIAIDQATETTIRKHLPQVNLVRVPNCVDLTGLPAPTPITKAARTVMYLGWVIPTKGMEELVRAWSELRPDGWRLRIVGPGDAAYRQGLVQRYRPEGVEFAGEQEHGRAMQMMAESAVFVLPSHTEGFPNVIVEAMALGRPIVATEVGAIPEMLADGCGALVPARDTESLKQALARMTGNVEAGCRMGERAWQRAHTYYALPAVFDRLVTLWCEAASG